MKLDNTYNGVPVEIDTKRDAGNPEMQNGKMIVAIEDWIAMCDEMFDRAPVVLKDSSPAA